MSLERPLESLSDDELLRGLADLLRQSRRAESDLVAHIAEVETRRLYAREAAPSMFVYCMDVLHLSEAEAYLRITAARAAREHPVLLHMLADGRLPLTGIAKLAPHLTPQNRDLLLSRAVHRSKRQIEELVAELAPRPDVPSVVRKLPSKPTPSKQEEAGVRFYPFRTKLCLLQISFPLQWPLRAVHRRDGGRCCFVDAYGRRCSERHRLEYHHRHPFGLGGGHDLDNNCLMCRTHNRYFAEIDCGTKALARHWGSAREAGQTTGTRVRNNSAGPVPEAVPKGAL